jgi:sugar lactone lactonase YvrE
VPRTPTRTACVVPEPVRSGLVASLVAAACVLAACGGGGKQASSVPKAGWPPAVAYGEMATIAGGGKVLGDGGPAVRAGFCAPVDVALDARGNLYVADAGIYCEGPGGNSVRKIDHDGVVTTIAGGGGIVGFAGDGGPATKAQLNVPLGVAVDREGNVFIADADNYRIRKVDPRGTITTIAGTGKPGFSGDGGPATSARLTAPGGLAVDEQGNLYVADYAAVRRIDRAGRITTVAGTGRSRVPFDPEHIKSAPRARFTGEGGRATDAMLHSDDVALDADGNLLIADDAGDRVYRVDHHGTIRTVAGTVSGKGTRLGDGSPATSAFIDGPAAVVTDRNGNLLIADHHGERIRKVDTHGVITTIAGTGVKGFNRERGPATKVQLSDPNALVIEHTGRLYVSDLFNSRIRGIRYDR